MSSVVKNEINIDALQERFRRFLYKNNGKLTNERIHLLRLLYQDEGHFSVDEIIDMASSPVMRVSRSTVYRTMDLLVQAGLARKLAFEGQETRFEAALSSEHHDHLICIDCHKIIEFYNDELEQIQDQILAEHSLKPVKHVHELYGTCTLQDCPERKVVEV